MTIDQVYIILGGHYKEIIRQYISNNKSISLPIKFVQQTKRIHSLCDLLLDKKNEITTPFLVHYGDILLEKFDFKKMFAFHKSMKKRYSCLGTLGISKYYSLGMGVVTIDKKKLLSRFVEKPMTGPLAWNMAVSIFEPRFLKYLRKYDDLFKDSLPRALENNEHFAAYEHNYGWYHIHTIADLYQQHVERYSHWLRR